MQPPYPARSNSSAPEGLTNYLQIDLGRLAYWLRQKFRWIVAAALIGLVLAVSYTVISKPRYTVTSELVIDPAGLQIVGEETGSRNDMRETLLLNADSKLQTLLSRNVLLRVIEKLDLTNDIEFVPAGGFSLFSFGGPATPVDPRIIALESLNKRLAAQRDEKSFVLFMSVWTWDAEKSIRISQALIEEFKAELNAGDVDGAKRTTDSLLARLTELKKGVIEAEEAVETFRRESGLRSSQGELSSSRSMVQVDTQLREARERLIAADSRYKQMLAGGNDSLAMQSATLAALRAQYSTLKQEADEQLLTFGTRHPRRAAVQSRLQSLDQEIAREMSRLTLAARNEYDQAKAVVEKLEGESKTVSTSVFSDNDAQVRLRELSREASARAAVYEAFLGRARMAAERQQLDTTNLRVISAPIAPRERSWPPSIAQAAVFGAAVGLTLGALGVLAFGIAMDVNHPQRGPEHARTETLDEDDPKEIERKPAPRTGSLLSMLSDEPSPAPRSYRWNPDA